MLTRLSDLLSSWLTVFKFVRIPLSKKPIVFYAENGSYVNYLAPVVDCLTNDKDQSIHYVTSDSKDPWLQKNHKNLTTHFVGNGASLITFFETLRCHVFVMTMPDLDSFHLKRSRNQVHYVYLHHSMISTHMGYKPQAFDAFDAIFCVGPHHEAETRQWEKIKGLQAKRLYRHGYGPLDQLRMQPGCSDNSPPSETVVNRILLAPSWGKMGILESCGEALIKEILELGYSLTIRPHPQTRKHTPHLIDDLKNLFLDSPNLTWEEDIRSHASLHAAHIMISDWSGVALEFAFGMERPVLYIDVPRKINNDDYTLISETPIEVIIREQIGIVVSPGDMAGLRDGLVEIDNNYASYCNRSRQARTDWVYNVGTSGEAAALALLEIDNEYREPKK